MAVKLFFQLGACKNMEICSLGDLRFFEIDSTEIGIDSDHAT
jgi:hypothetical protein